MTRRELAADVLDRAASKAAPKRFLAEPAAPSAFAPIEPETYRDKYDAFEREDDLREAAAEREERYELGTR